MDAEKIIDIDKVIASKNPKLQKRLPRFIVNYLKRTIHEDDLNRVLHKYVDTEGVDFIGHVLDEMQVKYSVEGLENLPQTGRFIFASNHPLGGLDGMVLIHLLGGIFSQIKFPVNDFLLHVKPLHEVFIPINKVGVQSAKNAILLDQAYDSAAQILYFPAGLCSRKQKNGTIRDLEWQKSFVVKAIRYRRDIVPVYFEGRNSRFFYSLARIRKMLGIKFNIEMLYLVDEMFRQKGQPISVKFGAPISYTEFDGSKTAKQWANWVREIVYGMKS